MAKGGAAKGAKRARFEEHRVSKKLRQHKKLREHRLEQRGLARARARARAPTKAALEKEEQHAGASKRRGTISEVPAPVRAPSSREARLWRLRRLMSQRHPTTTTTALRTKALAQLLISITRRDGRAQLDMPTWLREFVERQWTPEDDAMLAITWSWRMLGRQPRLPEPRGHDARRGRARRHRRCRAGALARR